MAFRWRAREGEGGMGKYLRHCELRVVVVVEDEKKSREMWLVYLGLPLVAWMG